jgi:uncharacterized protein (DUF488 family)
MNAACRDPRVVHTIGHSTRAIEAFCALLEVHAIDRVVDVRRWPASRRHPQFGREPLTRSLTSHRIEYVWREELGGFRSPRPDSPNTGWRTPAFRAYADFMLTPEFEAAIASLEAVAAARRIALMCAEAVPWRCHRQLLADAFTVRDWRVRHIMDDGCHVHSLTPFARPSGVRIHYVSRVLGGVGGPESVGEE